ncbi:MULTISPECIES: DctP family TRAP transporter solute-binding subunit [Fusobacterium]|uniref:Neu5Ac-binding protein n=1 Tax=Fusobacterium ulcerans TaxID=861 RepID=A0AAX2JDT3_9FUSO|nr:MULTISPECIES: DctP family TRAP transporter solute-binding subunit [Fusobacterium]AVQ27337.1 TRAP transporter substrate-binding protein DctP [Fusobacterium ulcerans]EFS24531.1 DctP family TRAP transporter solute receptor [Fusobacterium ulcerans ATCC 49185]MCB8565072.1 DctP family TRAP transporter solute-binding subunit [Fusobacterium ulcerans]MCB8648985.1 DctP family TRAP transporter solute-binding subunit [Fusobacterium ulcerans]MDH6458595.1 tripartite ATP-independent transporter DctP famil
MFKEKLTKIFSIAAAGIMLFSLMGCGDSSQDGKIIIRMTHTQQPESISDLTAKEFQKYVDKKSDGRIRIEIYQNCGLSGGDLTKAIELVQAGNIDIHACAPANIANYNPKFYAFWLPFLFDSTEDLVRFVNSERAKNEINKWCNDLEMTMLGINNAGSRQISSNKEIHSPKDLKGMNIRVPGANVFIDLYRDYFKANPTAMDFSEVYTSLQQKTIDGQENPIAVFNSSKFAEVQSNVLLWDGVRDTNIWVISNKTLEKLSPEDAKIIQESAAEALQWGNDYLAANESSIIENLEKNGTKFARLTDEERQEFKEACAGIFVKYVDVVGPDVIDLFQGK